MGRLENLKILVVEDEAGACEVASTILKQARSEVRTAKSACEALEVTGEWLSRRSR
jgi:CheY-like chemotaxis protein